VIFVKFLENWLKYVKIKIYMKIGIFDSGVGGLIIARAIRKLMPEYDYAYLGDTKRVPYGNRSHETVYEFTCQGVDYLFAKEDCAIVVIACNTASARALRKIQQEYLPKFWSDRKVIGVLIPTAEEGIKYKKVGIIATVGTVASETFPNEIKKLGKKTQVFQNPAPMLVSFAEEGEGDLAKPFIEKYLKPLVEKRIDALVLGCTHYPFYKEEIRKFLGPKIKVLSQDEIIPEKLKEYFTRHEEIENKLSKNGKAKILVTDITKNVERLSSDWFGENSRPELVKL
jgi:glutamate racemase